MSRFERAANGAGSPSDLVTTGATHVRRAGDLRTYYGRFLFALLPCVLFGLYNTGYQANLALSALGRDAAPGWRGALAQRLSVDTDPASLADCIARGALQLFPLWLATYVAGYACELGFALLRGRARSPGLGLFALLFTLYLPPTLPLWQAVLGISFGVVIGKEVFGGTGRNIVHPVLAGLAFLFVTYPEALHGAAAQVAVDGHAARTGLSLAAAGGIDALRAADVKWVETLVGRQPGSLGATSTLACLVGAVYLVITRTISWRILLGACVGFLVAALCTRWTLGGSLPAADLPWHWQLTIGSFAFIAVFIATDPVTAAMTQAGRLVYGLSIGGLAVVIRVANPVLPEGAVLATLLGNVFAPLIDHGVMRLHIRRRRRRLEQAGGA